MECSKCKRILEKKDFSYKNEKEKIYYMYCNNCRSKVKTNEKQLINKENYELTKKLNLIECECGKTYIAFRNYHTVRHQNSKSHKDYIISK